VISVNPFVHASFKTKTKGITNELMVSLGSLGPSIIPTSIMFFRSVMLLFAQTDIWHLLNIHLFQKVHIH